jgi:hypothetical protein
MKLLIVLTHWPLSPSGKNIANWILKESFKQWLNRLLFLMDEIILITKNFMKLALMFFRWEKCR